MQSFPFRVSLCIALLSATGLAPARADAGQDERRWRVDGVERRALVFAPSSEAKRSTRTPLLFAFHGHGGTMRQAAARMGFQRQWPEAIVVYMQGLPTPGALTDPQGLRNGWQNRAGDQNDRDLKFFDAVLATLKKEYEVDEKRIFATGHSNGGGFTFLLWAERGATFAAVAPVAAVAGRNATRMKPKPALHVAGENDALVRYAWQKASMERVRALNGCTVAGKEWAKEGSLIATIYPSTGGTPFVSAIHSGGHAYPSFATALIVRFFKERENAVVPAAPGSPR